MYAIRSYYGHLVQYLIVTLVQGIIIEELLVERDCLAGARPFEIISTLDRPVSSRCLTDNRLPLGCPSFKVLI